MIKRNPVIVMLLIVILTSACALGLAYALPRAVRAIAETLK